MVERRRVRGRRLGRGGALARRRPCSLWHELPAPRAGAVGRTSAHRSATRIRALLRRRARRRLRATSSSTSTWCTAFQRAVVEALRAVPCGEIVTYGELAALAGHPNAQRARPARSARTTASRSSSRATASSPPAGSARTARSASATSAGCWSSRVSFSEDVRTELAAIAPERECDRLAELSALFHSAGRLHLRGRGEVVAPPRPGELGGRAAGVQRCCARSASTRRSGPTGGAPSTGRPATSSTSRTRRAAAVLKEPGVVDAALAAAASGRRKRVVGRGCCRARLPARRAARGRLGQRAAVAAPRDPLREPRGARSSSPRPRRRGRRAPGRATAATSRSPTRKGSTASPTCSRLAGASDAALALEERAVVGSAPRRREPARERRPRQPRPHEPRRPRAARGGAPARARAPPGRALAPAPGDRGAAAEHPSLSLRELGSEVPIRRSRRRRLTGACGADRARSDSGIRIGASISTTCNRVALSGTRA